MKTKLQTALRSNVDPFFFALSCALLLCISFTAKAIADDIGCATSGPPDIMMMTPDGNVVWSVE